MVGLVKRDKIAALVQSWEGGDLDPHYLAFFDCFNRQLFFEAHEVLEELWLAERHRPRDRFYKGLIQIAGAFVHIKHGRSAPAAALMELARANLLPYAPVHDRLQVSSLLECLYAWLLRLKATPESDRELWAEPPLIRLQPPELAAGG